MAHGSKAAVLNAYLNLGQSLSAAGQALTDFTKTLQKSDVAQIHEELNALEHPLALLGKVLPEVFQAYKIAHEHDEDVAGVNGTNEIKGKGKGKGKEDKAGDDSKPVLTKEKKVKKARDPEAPKRPPSAYLEFQNSVREHYRKEDPSLTYTETLKKIAAVWAAMSEDEKKPFQDITAKKTADFTTAHAEYVGSHPEGWEYQAPEPVVSADAPGESKKRVRKPKEVKGADAKVAQKDIEVTDVEMTEAGEKKKKAKKDKKVAVPVVAVKSNKTPTVKVPTPVQAASETEDSEDDSEDSDDDGESLVASTSVANGIPVDGDSDESESDDTDSEQEDQILPTPVKAPAPVVASASSSKKKVAEDKHKAKKVKA